MTDQGSTGRKPGTVALNSAAAACRPGWQTIEKFNTLRDVT
jgi:hypothetical protein